MYKRKYKKGEVINSIDELINQDFIYFESTVYHKGWFMSWQFRIILNWLKAKRIYKAVKIEDTQEGEIT
jgi:hypothetical protein